MATELVHQNRNAIDLPAVLANNMGSMCKSNRKLALVHDGILPDKGGQLAVHFMCLHRVQNCVKAARKS